MKARILCFKLSMPGNNAWNGKWSGDGKLFAILKRFTTKKGYAMADAVLVGGHYNYSFGDGWRARIDVTEIDAKAATEMRKKSCGFCGYDWMVDSILTAGVILPDAELRDFLQKKKAEV